MRAHYFALLLCPLLLAGPIACGNDESTQQQGSGASIGGSGAAGGNLAVAERAELQRARAAVTKLGMALKKELSGAMQEGGPEAALHVCNTKAAEVTETLCSDSGLDVARVSSRWRNPDNQPDPLEGAVLAVFEADPAHGDTLLTLDDGGFLYMKPIRVGSPLCLECHGTEQELADGVPERLAELYPEDHATGFSEGDLRGAFTVRFPTDTP